LKLGPLVHDECWRQDFFDERGGLHQLHSLIRRHLRLDAPAADHRAGGNRSMHHAIFTDNDLSIGLNVAVEAAINPDCPFHMNLASQQHTFGQEGNVVISSKAIGLHALYPLLTRSLTPAYTIPPGED